MESSYHRVKRESLKLDPSSLIRRTDDDLQDSPLSTVDQSPLTPSHSSVLDARELDTVKESASGPQRAQSSPASSSRPERERRKRSRVTPEQLSQLERLFSTERSPTAARRREISERLGMHERQTQIWFQNRRAKAKLQDGKQKGRSGSTEALPDTPPELSTGFEIDLHNLIHEDESVTIVPCTVLTVGTWRRIASTTGKHDLVAYVCESKRCLTWFIHSAGSGFKMEIPFHTILETTFSNAAPGSGLASFVLSQPPVFYIENISATSSTGTVVRHWKRCADWTEGHQATQVLRHELVGSAVQLAHLLRNLQAGASDIALHTPYRSTEPAPIPMELSQPPLASFATAGYHHETPEFQPPEHHVQSPRRSESMTSSLAGSPFSTVDPDPRLLTGASAPFSHPHHESLRSIPPSPNFIQHSFSGPRESAQHSIELDNYGSVAISHGLAPRPYATQPVPRTFYQNDGSFVSGTLPGDIEQRHSQSLSPLPFTTSSLPLLTSAYHPHPQNLANIQSDLFSNNTSAVTGLPGISFDADSGIHFEQSH